MPKNAKTRAAPLLTFSRSVAIFTEAIQLPKESRRAYVEKQVGDDTELLREVQALFAEEAKAPSTDRASSPRDLRIGERVGDFEIVRVLGEGGFAVVYLARQISLDREVALKVSANIGQEARILASLEHDNIVKVHLQTIEPRRRLRLVCMQYIPGTTLADVIGCWPSRNEALDGASLLSYLSSNSSRGSYGDSSVSAERAALRDLDHQELALWLGKQLANALAYAHQQGVLHLDVKPSNVILSRSGRPYLTDFNVSLDQNPTKGHPLILGGTFDYMAPEHHELLHSKGSKTALRRIDHRADLYSLGVVIREFLSRTVSPVDRENAPSRRHTRLLKSDTAQPARARFPLDWRRVDLGVRLVLNKCTAADPDARFASAAALSQAFEACLELRAILKSVPRPGRLFALASRLPLLSTSLAALVPLWLASASCFYFLPLALPGLFAPRVLPEQMNMALAIGADLACTVFWILWHYPLLVHLGSPRSLIEQSALAGKLRRRILSTPNFFFALTTLIWLPVHLLALGWNPTTRAMVPLSGLSSVLMVGVLTGLIATGLGALLSQLFALRAIYPRLWLGCHEIRDTAAAELAPLRARLRVFYFALAWAPMLSAAFCFFDPAFSGWHLAVIVSVLLAVGFLAILFNFTLSQSLAQLVTAFTGGEWGGLRSRRI